jgi:hypothetical protein
MRNGTSITLETQPFRSDTPDFSICVGEHGDQSVNRRGAWSLPERPGRNPAYITVTVPQGLKQHRDSFLTGEIR